MGMAAWGLWGCSVGFVGLAAWGASGCVGLQRTAQRGGEEHRLPLRGEVREDRRNVGGEAHLEQPVGLVDDQHAKPAERQRDVTRGEVVHQPARRGHHNVRPLGQHESLLHHVVAAHDRHDLDAHPRPERRHLVGDLRRQLTGGREDQTHHAVRVARQRLQHRQHEGGGLPRARLSGTEDVLPSERRPDARRLYGRGYEQAQLLAGVNQPGREADLVEGNRSSLGPTHRGRLCLRRRSINLRLAVRLLLHRALLVRLNCVVLWLRLRRLGLLLELLAARRVVRSCR